MKLFNLGSINIDHFYRLPHLVSAGETLAACEYNTGLGGKGANQSIAAALGGAEVHHIGAINVADQNILALLRDKGVLTDAIRYSDAPTGHAIVMVDQHSGENQIIIYPGANHQISTAQINDGLVLATVGDWALAQNETNNAAWFFQQARARGLKICYSAAPFEPATTAQLLAYTDLLVVNEGEAEALCNYLNRPIDQLPVAHLILTLGAAGARYLGCEGRWQVAAPRVPVVDTTGAGDTFLGYLLAGLCRGDSMRSAMELAVRAAAIKVTRAGTGAAIPSLDEVLNSPV